MNKKSNAKLWISYIKSRRAGIFLYLSTAGIFLFICCLNQLYIFQRLLYAFLLSGFFWVCYGVIDGLHYIEKIRNLELSYGNPGQVPLLFCQEEGGSRDGKEEAYEELLRHLYRLKVDAEAEKEMQQHEREDYYMMWAHQIKTPIAAMKLLLEDREGGFPLKEELFKIEQYVEMVLHYLRLESIAGDMELKEYDLYTLVKQTVRKYSILFINSGLSLHLKPFQAKVLTDEKWLCFVLEQLLSNCIKYTREGSISIYMKKDEECTLMICDTGMGIREEDLPRIFERGFTGYNGRVDKKATGIGLYLSGIIMKHLAHGIRVESEEGKGTRIYLDLSRQEPTEE